MKPEKEEEFEDILARLELGDEGLKEVDLADFGLDGADTLLLANVLPHSKVTNLNLSGNDIGAAGVATLANVLTQSQVTSFSLGFNQIGDEGATTLANVLAQSQVTSLSLGFSQIGDKGATALAQALPQSKVTSLNLQNNQISDNGAAKLAQWLPQSQASSLNLQTNEIGSIGAAVLAKALPQSQVKSFNLRGNEIGSIGAVALANALPQSQVTSLDLSINKIWDKGATALAQCLPQSQVTDLNLSGNDISDAGAAALAKALPQSQVTNLDLSCNDITHEGASVIAKVLPRSKIVNLDLSGNACIGDIGAAALAKALPQSQVTSLSLERNNIGDKGAFALTDVLLQSQVTSLNLSNNRIRNSFAAALADVLLQSQITNFNLSNDKVTYDQTDYFAMWKNQKTWGSARLAAVVQSLPQNQATSLDLSNSEIEDVGAAALAQALPQSQVTSLNLYSNKIGADGATALAKALPQSKVVNLDLRDNNIGYEGAVALADILPQSQVTNLNLYGNKIGEKSAFALAKVLSQSQVTSLGLNFNEIGHVGAAALAQCLPQSQVTNLNLSGNKIGDAGAAALAKALPQSQVTSLDLSSNKIRGKGAAMLAKALPQSQVTSLDLDHNKIGDAGAAALAKTLPQSQVINLNLTFNYMGDKGAIALAQCLPQSQVTNLNLSSNKISGKGAAILAKALPLGQVTSLDLSGNDIGGKGAAEFVNVLLQSKITSLKFSLTLSKIGREVSVSFLEIIKLSCNVTEISELQLEMENRAILAKHLGINKLLNAKNSEDMALAKFIQGLESNALMHINQQQLLDDVSLEKPKRLLLKAMELGSIQSIYLLGNLYLNEFKNLAKAKEYYSRASELGHEISKLCLQMMEQKELHELELDALTINLPRRFSLSTTQQKLALREEKIISLSTPNALVSKTGISLSALQALKYTRGYMDVYVATQDYEPAESEHLHFNQGQTIYIKHVDDVKRNFADFLQNVLTKSYIPYNKDKQNRRRAEVGFISYDMYLNKTHFQAKPWEDWSAEDVCNAIITPKTKPLAGEKAKPYVDTLPAHQRGKPFEGYILSYARITKFTDILNSLNERFKERNPDEVFIWIDLAGINQHAWMDMNSADIGKILEVNLTQLFTYVSEGRLIHFDKASPTNLTRSWCLVELLSCLKAQENTVAQTEICMGSEVQAEVLAQDLMRLLNSLDASKAECFNPTDKIAIDMQIKRSLTNMGEAEISMETAFARLNAVVKSWLVTKFLPDFSNIKELEQKVPELANADNLELTRMPLTVAYDAIRSQEEVVLADRKSQEKPNLIFSKARREAAAQFEDRSKKNKCNLM